ncbi:hypothetical protein M5K25_010532 [Dendrobium thyrsiflorum]|uniref:Methyltransferase type 11 domain-containing protein n=1 Tax=Dendrobium thyrsiflorum TaxID=117978 RepID=A0ABD0V0G3_DENTH
MVCLVGAEGVRFLEPEAMGHDHTGSNACKIQAVIEYATRPVDVGLLEYSFPGLNFMSKKPIVYLSSFLDCTNIGAAMIAYLEIGNEIPFQNSIAIKFLCSEKDLMYTNFMKLKSQLESLILYPNSQVSALDFSRKQLFIASTRQDLFWKACYKNIKWIEDDALNLPFEDSYFNAVTVGFGLRNLVDKRKAMQEIFRVLKPGSKVSILDFNKSTSSWISQCQDWTLDNMVVPIASTYGLSEEYKYIKSSIAEFLTGEMSQIKDTMEDRLSSVEGKVLSMEDKVSDLHLIMKKIFENQIQVATLEAKELVGRTMNSDVRRREGDGEIIEEKGKELEKLAREVGFSDARHYEISAGLMGNLVGTR